MIDTPNDAITAELLEGGTFLKKAIEICNRDRTQPNLLKLMQILRDSWVWIPCNAIMSDADYATMEKMVKEAQENGGLDSLVGKMLSNQDNIRMVPDILKNGENTFSQYLPLKRRWVSTDSIFPRLRSISWKLQTWLETMRKIYSVLLLTLSLSHLSYRKRCLI